MYEFNDSMNDVYEQEASLIMERLYISEMLYAMNPDDPGYNKLCKRLNELDELQSNLNWTKIF